MRSYLGVEFDAKHIRKVGSFTAYSYLQEAEVQFFCENDNSIVARHCGNGAGSFYTEFVTVLEPNES